MSSTRGPTGAWATPAEAMRRLLTWFSAVVIRALASTMRMELEDRAGILHDPDLKPIIFAFWHNRLFLMAPFYERYCHYRGAVVLVSRSKDGQFISDVIGQFGLGTVRGSSSRYGAAAAMGALRAARDKELHIVITPDGPRGPKYQIHPGLLRLAQTTGCPIVPVTHQLKWKWELKSWDRFQVPLPFSMCRLITQPPIFVPGDSSDNDLEVIRMRVTQALGGD